MAEIGGAGFGARRFGAPPVSGTQSSVAPEPAWAPSAVYNIDPTDGISRVLNVGNLYQCKQDGTSASSGGPTGTGTSIADGSTLWIYLGPAPTTNTLVGSQILGILVRGNEASTPTIPPFDNTSSGPYTTISDVPYGSFPSSFAGVFYRPTPSPAKTNFILTAEYGASGGGGDGDELNVHWLEMKGVTPGAPHAAVSSEKIAIANILTSDLITTTVECLVISVWFGNGFEGVGNTHVAIPLNGLQLIPGTTSLLATSGGYVQVGVSWRIASAGTFFEQWQTTGEGAIMAVIAYAIGATGITGSLNATLAAATSVATGIVRVSGASNNTLAPTTLSAVGRVRVAGAVASTLAGATLSATGTIPVRGSVAATLTSTTLTGAGRVRVAGSAAPPLSPTTLQATGLVDSAPVVGVQGVLQATLKATTSKIPGIVSGIPPGMLSLMGGGDVEVHPTISGPIPNSPYEYLCVPPRARSVQVLKEIETAISSVGFAERRDLVNGVRAYRVLFHTLWRMQSDAKGHFIPLAGKQLRFLINDPTLGVAALNDWAPI